MHFKVLLALPALLASLSGGTSLALAAKPVEENSFPDPAKVTVPEIATSDPKALSNGNKFFVFHSQSVDFETAYTDISECRSFLPAAATSRVLPTFTAWGYTTPSASTRSAPNPYGLVGDAILTFSAPALERGSNNVILRRCMETRGYVRYPVTEAVWKTLNDSNNPMTIAMQAKLASGPTPPQAKAIDQ